MSQRDQKVQIELKHPVALDFVYLYLAEASITQAALIPRNPVFYYNRDRLPRLRDWRRRNEAIITQELSLALFINEVYSFLLVSYSSALLLGRTARIYVFFLLL